MKNLLLALNAILILAVGFLYFKVFGKDKKVEKKTVATTNSSSNSKSNLIAYVELDSLQANISYIKQKKKELEAEQKAIESEWTSGMRNLEKQRDNFVQKGGNITQDEVEAFREKLMVQQQQIEERKNASMQKLGEKNFNFQEDMSKKLKNFLKEYNADKNYSYIFTAGTGLDYMVFKDSANDITADVVEGMNKELNQKK